MVLASEVGIGIIGKFKSFRNILRRRCFHREQLLWDRRTSSSLTQKDNVSLEDLRGMLFIHREAGTRTRVQIEQWLREHQVAQLVSIEVGHIEAVKKRLKRDRASQSCLRLSSNANYRQIL